MYPQYGVWQRRRTHPPTHPPMSWSSRGLSWRRIRSTEAVTSKGTFPSRSQWAKAMVPASASKSSKSFPLLVVWLYVVVRCGECVSGRCPFVRVYMGGGAHTHTHTHTAQHAPEEAPRVGVCVRQVLVLWHPGARWRLMPMPIDGRPRPLRGPIPIQPHRRIHTHLGKVVGDVLAAEGWLLGDRG